MNAARQNGRPSGRVPLYRQVEAELLRRIRAGTLKPGERLPTEPELAAEWGVNRLTIRQAIGELARAGHVTVRQGSGTHVAAEQLTVEYALPTLASADADVGSATAMPIPGQEDQTETLVEVSEQDAFPAAQEALGLSEPLLRVDTLVEAGGQPLLMSSYWLHAERFPGFAGHLADRIAPLEVLREHYGVNLRHAWRALTATLASSADATLLDIVPGSPVMFREGANVDEQRVPTLYLQRRIRGDRIKFTMNYSTA
ncbi:GntR family transcriptional regulator [Saccharopolyspora sp. NPDC049357]|uniref:GntR family transcriptional regulator n=1 Tax=Saccharopolyspora sp. NPDC049357 TaxID=3154507 RepID=UPI003433DC05